MENKIKRFVELSAKFCEMPMSIKSVESSRNDGFVMNDKMYFNTGSVNGVQYQEVTPRKTNSELIQDKANKEKQTADEWDEFLKLKTDLSNYYNSLEKLK